MGWTPLHAAVSCTALTATPVAELLLSAGTAIDGRNEVRGNEHVGSEFCGE